MSAANPLMQVQDLSLHFPKKRRLTEVISGQPARTVRALNKVSFDVFRGETLGIVGESGCGKSTLARCMVGLYKPTTGSMLFEDTNITSLNSRQMQDYHRRVQMIFQDPYSSLNPRMTVGEILAEALQVHNMRSRDDIPARVSELLDLVRLPADSAFKLPHQFSGGQRQRIAIARALCVEPEVIIADELVSALDVSVQAQIVNLLLDLQSRLNLTILFIAHDLRLVRHVSHRIAVLYLGSVVELGESERVFANPSHPYSKALLGSAPSIDPDKANPNLSIEGELPSPLDLPRGCAFQSRCPIQTAICKDSRPKLQMSHNKSLVACHHVESLADTP